MEFMKRKILIIVLTSLSLLSFGQSFQWAKQIAGNGTFDVSISEIMTVSNGDIIIAGSFSGEVDFDTSLNVLNKNSQGVDGFVARYDDGGNLIWVYTTNEVGNEYIKDAALTVGSNFQTRIILAIQIENNGFKLSSLIPQTGAFYLDSPVYTTSGQIEVNAINNDFTTAETHYYVVGSFTGTMNIGSYTRTSFGQKDAFIAKFSTSSNTSLYNFNWLSTFGGPQDDEALDVNNNTNLTLVGSFEDVADFDGDPNTSTLNKTSNGNKDAFAIVINKPNGYVLSDNDILTFGGIGDDAITSIDKVSTAHNFGGYFSDVVELVPGDPSKNLISAGQKDGFVAKYFYNTNFVLSWANYIGDVYDDVIDDISISSGSSNVYFIMQKEYISSNRTYLGAYSYQGNSISYGGDLLTYSTTNQNFPTAIEALNSGDVYTAGTFDAITDFNPAIPNNIITPLVGGNNSFIHKMSNCNLSADTPTISISKTVACQDDMIVLTIISNSRLNNNNNWVWYSDACGGNYIGMGKSITIPAQYSTTFYARGEGGCMTNGNCSNGVSIIVNPLPDATLTVTGNTITSNEAGGAYQWLDCNNGNAQIFGATSQSFTPSSSGSYACLVANMFDCQITTNCVNITVLSTDDFSKLGVKLYPNPVKNSFKIEGDVFIETLSIYDILGQKIKSFTNINTFDIEDLASGTYIVEIISNKGTANTKIIKE